MKKHGDSTLRPTTEKPLSSDVKSGIEKMLFTGYLNSVVLAHIWQVRVINQMGKKFEKLLKTSMH